MRVQLIWTTSSYSLFYISYYYRHSFLQRRVFLSSLERFGPISNIAQYFLSSSYIPSAPCTNFSLLASSYRRRRTFLPLCVVFRVCLYIENDKMKNKRKQVGWLSCRQGWKYMYVVSYPCFGHPFHAPISNNGTFDDKTESRES